MGIGVRERSFKSFVEHNTTAPAVYVVDDDCRIVLSRDENGSAEKLTERLAEEVERKVRELKQEEVGYRESDGSLPFKLLDSSLVVRITPLGGCLGNYTAVLVEHVRGCDHLSTGSRKYRLTRREREIVEHLIDGARTAEIAEALGIAQSTVILHVKSAMVKTDSRTRAEMLGRIMSNDGELAM